MKPNTTKVLIVSCAVVLSTALISISLNTSRVNRAVADCSVELIPLNAALANVDSVFKYHADSTQQLILLKVDAKDLQQHLVELHESAMRLKEQKRWLLDANAISFLFQLLSVLLIAIGMYLLQTINNLVVRNKKITEHFQQRYGKFQEHFNEIASSMNHRMQQLTKRASQFDHKVKTRQMVNQIFSRCQIIHHCTLFLVAEPKMGDTYNDENLKFCYNINEECTAIQQQVGQFTNKWEFLEINKTDRKLLIGLLKGARVQMERLKLPETGNYYKEVHDHITTTINCIRGKQHKKRLI